MHASDLLIVSAMLRRFAFNDLHLARRHGTFPSAFAYGPNSLGRCSSRDAPIDIHPEVQDALHNKRPVVALESTIITHGMPSPTNFETALSVENIVRSTGSVPATIAIVDGRVKIGLQPSELERLADVKTSSPVKVSRRDIGPCLALRKNGGTTCSATLIFASLAGIKVCVLPFVLFGVLTESAFSRFLAQEGL